MEWVSDKLFWQALWNSTTLLVRDAITAFAHPLVSGGIGAIVLLLGIWVAVVLAFIRDVGSLFVGRRVALRARRRVEGAAAIVILPLVVIGLVAQHLGH